MPSISEEDRRRYQAIEDRLAQIDSASDEAATLRLERSELDEKNFPDDCSEHLPIRQHDERCLYCGTNHRLEECQWVRDQVRALRRQG